MDKRNILEFKFFIISRNKFIFFPRFSQGYGASSGNGYGGAAQGPPQAAGYGAGYGAQPGYPQSYQGYESYQQPADYGQSAVSYSLNSNHQQY